MPGVIPAPNETNPEVLSRAIRHLAETGFDLSILNAVSALAVDDTFPFYDTSTGLNAKVTAANLAVGLGVIPDCGRLSFSSTTALLFKPFNGDRIRIAGVLYQIPAGGIAGLANTGVYVNGAAGQNLAASTNYLICAFNNGGTITADYITTLTHVRDTTTGNEGTEIKSGDASRTVIGLCRLNGSTQFSDPLTLSWFNKRLKRTEVANGGGSTLSTTPISFVSAVVLAWQDDPIWFALHVDTQVTGGTGIVYRAIDTVAINPIAAIIGTFSIHTTLDGWSAVGEGNHTFEAYAYNLVGGPTLYYFNVLLESASFG